MCEPTVVIVTYKDDARLFALTGLLSMIVGVCDLFLSCPCFSVIKETQIQEVRCVIECESSTLRMFVRNPNQPHLCKGQVTGRVIKAKILLEL